MGEGGTRERDEWGVLIRYRFSSVARKTSPNACTKYFFLYQIWQISFICWLFAIRMQNEVFYWVCFGRFSLREKQYLKRRLIRRFAPPYLVGRCCQLKRIPSKRSTNIAFPGVPSSPAAAGASPRRSLGNKATPWVKYFSCGEMWNFCFAKVKFALRASEIFRFQRKVKVEIC